VKKKNQIPSISKDKRLFNINKPLIGLTGSIATGKSTVSNFLSNNQIPIICADTLIKSIYKYNSIKKFVAKNYPQAVINNEINFNTLRTIAFNNIQIKLDLEKELYQHLESEFKKTLSTIPQSKYIFYHIPLLFEKRLEENFDYIICVYVNYDIQIQRLKKRDNIDEQLAKKMIRSQFSIEHKKNLADHVIDNSGTLEETKIQTNETLIKIEKLSRS
jgi:dephospho-CoA kinase